METTHGSRSVVIAPHRSPEPRAALAHRTRCFAFLTLSSPSILNLLKHRPHRPVTPSPLCASIQ